MNEVIYCVYTRESPVYRDLIVQAADRLMSLSFRLVSGTTKRSHLESMMNIVDKVPLGFPFDNIYSNIIVGKNISVEAGKYSFRIESEQNYRYDTRKNELVELDDFWFEGLLIAVPSEEVVSLEIQLELPKTTKDWRSLIPVMG